MAQVRKVDIINGPSKWDLILALFEGDSLSRRQVKFTIRRHIPFLEFLGTEPYVVINEIGRESGCKETWLFKGYMGENITVEGYFHTDNRKGWIKVVE
ncbi:MAG: hypothetical protein AAB581_02875 [Patescibacteria group bacterium]